MIKSKLINIIIFIFVSSTLYATQETQDKKVISIRADTWPPYNGTPHSKQPGYIIEIAEFAFKKHGYTMDYQISPWERSIELVANGEANCVVGAYKPEVPGFIFTQQHLGIEDVGFYARSDSRAWKFESLDSFKGYTIGVIGGYSYGPLIDSYIANPNSQVHVSKGDDALDRNLKMLMHNRIDILLESPNVMNYQKTHLPFARNIKLLDTYPMQEKIYIACSPQDPESKNIVKMIDEAVTELRKSGKLAKILKSYGLEDWQQPSEIKK